MNKGRYRIYKAVIAGGLAIAVGIAIVTGTAVLALAAVIAAIVIAFIMERRNREVVQDERIKLINGKAATAALNASVIVAAIASLGIALFRNQLPAEVVFFGTIMGYFICLALLLHMGFYMYYSRKM